MTTNTLILAAAAEKTNLEIIADGIVGIFVVLFILFVLTGLIASLSLLFKEKPKTAAKPAENNALDPQHLKVVLAAAAKSVNTAGISENHLRVVIAAAVKTVLAAAPRAPLHLAPADTAWAAEGRRAIFQSHRPRK